MTGSMEMPQFMDAEQAPGIDSFQMDRIRWAMKSANGEALVALVSADEIVFIVKEYLNLLDDLDNYATNEEQRNFAMLRDMAIWRIDGLLFQGVIDRATVDAMSRQTLGTAFPSQAVETPSVAVS